MHPRLQELFGYLDQQRASLRAAFDAVPPALRNRSPAPERWATAGVIEHLAIVETFIAGMLSTSIAAARADGVGAETSTAPVLPTIDLASVINRTSRVTAPDVVHPSGLDAAAAWAALETASESFRAAARGGDGLALGLILEPHPVFGPLSLYHWIALSGAHEARHAAQIREMTETLIAEPAAVSGRSPAPLRGRS